MTDFYDFTTGRRARRIVSTEVFSTKIDIAPFVRKLGADFVCSDCEEVLVRIEPDGILGESLNELDTAVILDHYVAKHPAEGKRT
jgi:hypothetical protein